MKILTKSSHFNLIKSFGIYTLVNVFNSSIPIILPFILSKVLFPSDFGVLTNINFLFFILVPLIGFSASSAISRQFVKKHIDVPEYMGNVYILGLFNSIIFFLLLMIFKSKIIEVFKVNDFVVNTICIYAFTHNIMEMVFSFWRMQDNIKKYSFFRLGKSILELPLSYLLSLLFHNWEGRYYSILLLNILFVLVISFILIKGGYLKIKVNFYYIKHLFLFGLPLIPHVLSGVIVMYADKLLISNYISINKNGLYSISFQIGMVISLFQNSFNQAWVPWFFKKLSIDSSFSTLKTLVKYNYVYFIFLFLMLIVLFVSSPFIFSFLGSEYEGGEKYVWIIGLGFVFKGMYKMFVNYIFYLEKNNYVFRITFVSATLIILFNLFLIPKYGVIGAAWSFAITCFIELVLTCYISSRMFPLPWFFYMKKYKNTI